MYIKILSIIILTAFTNIILSQNCSKVIKINNNIGLCLLKDSVFTISNYYEMEHFGRVESNGLLIVKNAKAILVDTRCDNEQTSQLYSYLKDSMHITITKVIVCHYHIDCLGGLGFIQQQGIESISLDLTKEKCIEKKLPIPSVTFSEKLILNFEGADVICQYFGSGHTVDNIIVYLPKNNILFGGCLIKSLSSKNLGNTADAVIDKWPITVENLQVQYKKAEIVIPGHGEIGGLEIVKHTLKLAGKK